MPRAPTSSITGKLVRRFTLRRPSSPELTGYSPSGEGGVVLRHSSESPPQPRKAVRRSKTFTGSSSSFKKPHLSFRGNSSAEENEEPAPVVSPRVKKKKSTQRSGSQFYEHEDITRRIIEPRDFPELNLKDKNAKELLLMLRPVNC